MQPAATSVSTTRAYSSKEANGGGAQVFYNLGYVCLWAAGFTFAGLLLLRFVRDRIEIE